MSTTTETIGHTPGPWHTRGPNGRPHDQYYSVVAPDRLVATTDDTDPVDLANARLISQAPEMAEALERILNDLRTEMGALTVSANFGYAESILARVRGEEGR